MSIAQREERQWIREEGAQHSIGRQHSARGAGLALQLNGKAFVMVALDLSRLRAGIKVEGTGEEVVP